MSKNKIIDLTQFRQEKTLICKDSDPRNKNDQPFEKKLQDLIHRPLGETGSKEELIAIFEEKQLKKDEEDIRLATKKNDL
jgi:hypothetical protein